MGQINAPWTTPADLRAQVQRLWDSGAFLAWKVGVTADFFPKRLSLKGPSSAELLNRFEDARAWSRKLCDVSHLRVELRDFKHRSLGQNAIPEQVWLDTLDAGLALLNKRKDAIVFDQIVAVTQVREPSLMQWLGRRPIKALELAAQWTLLLDVVSWMRNHPNSGVYVRQIDIAGVHSKFIESHRAVLNELIEIAAPQCIVSPEIQALSRFAKRYGFREKPDRVRFRMLEIKRQFLPTMNLQDVELDSDSFANLMPDVEKVFITENEINFLAFPSLLNGMVIFGSGYGFDALSKAKWLNERQIFYWGDIDTHGFAILNELRHHFPHTTSLLMDRATLLKFKDFWGVDKTPTNRDLPLLDTQELELYNDLRDQRLGANLRLEQEHIGFDWFLKAVES
jgi:hypothetical protein